MISALFSGYPGQGLKCVAVAFINLPADVFLAGGFLGRTGALVIRRRVRNAFALDD